MVPKASATNQSSRLRPRTTGRAMTASTSALVASRNHTMAVGGTCANRSLATAAPNCTERMPPSTSHTGERRRTRDNLRSATWPARPGADRQGPFGTARDARHADISACRGLGHDTQLAPVGGGVRFERVIVSEGSESAGKEAEVASTVVMVGTRKGLWVGTSDDRREEWAWTGPHFAMEEVYSCLVDRRTSPPRLLAGASSSWFGPQVRRSDDLGASWQETPEGAVRFPEDVDATLARVWQLQPGAQEGVVYAGTEPGAIFRSDDGGETFGLERGLWDHPHRPQWDAGFGGQAFHTILPHPTDPGSVVAAISTGGVYRTHDGGGSWEPANTGIKAEFFPGDRQYPEFGQCVHKVARHPSVPERMFLQNHGGVYRSDDGGDSWQDIAPGLPSEFGFPVVVHPHEPNTVFLFPLVDATARWPVDGQCRVWRSQDAGETWTALGEGSLPDDFFVAVMRDAMTADTHDPVGLYVGGRNGSVYSSADAGETWRVIHRDLPDVMVVRASAV